MTGNSNWDTLESDLIATLRAVLDNNNDAILVTVIDVEGNGYRRPGAKMLVSASGSATGLVAPQCLDAEIADICRTVSDEGTARLKRFDLSNEDHDSWGLGVGCDGVITFLFEPVDESHRPLVAASISSTTLVSLAVLPNDEHDQVSRFYYETENGFYSNTPTWIQAVLRDRIDDPKQTRPGIVADIMRPNGAVDIFVERIEPPPKLVIIGSGNDVRPVVNTAHRAGFQTVVVGFRGGKATIEKFPGADTVLSISPRELTDSIDIDGKTLFVLMTHNFVDDQLSLEMLLDTATPYIGVLGPQTRFQSLIDAMDKEGELTDSERDRVYAPVGLDLGGETPNHIALSIVSEALAVCNNRSANHLRNGEGHIHDRERK